MGDQKELLKLCRPLYIKLTRITNVNNNKWKQETKLIERTHPRRRTLSAWQRGDCRKSRSKKIRKIKEQDTKCVSSDSDDELPDCQSIGDNRSDMQLNICEEIDDAGATISEAKTEVIDNNVTLPNNNIPSDNSSMRKFKGKRRKVSRCSDSTVEVNETEKTLVTLEPNNSYVSSVHDITPVNLNKEIKIVSSRLEDSDDPQVERWRSKKKASSLNKSKARLPPKLDSLNCTVCSFVFKSKEELSNHIFKHTPRELQDAYKAAKIKLRENDNNAKVEGDGDDIDDCDVTCNQLNKFFSKEVSVTKETQQITSSTSLTTNKSTNVPLSVPMAMCSCHSETHSRNDSSVQIEMVLLCETCHVLFRRSECFETHYRFSSICNTDRTKGRTPKLFCSTCSIILNTLSNMRRHLEEHATINFNGTVTFVCNICRVVFFGVGTVFCNHWFSHEKDPTFVASRYSFPKLCVSTQGTKPFGSTPDEQYFFIAEYVCRVCKFQFSSQSELTNHFENDCNGSATHTQVQNKSAKLKSIALNSKRTKSASDTAQSENSLTPLKSLEMVNKWICEFCNECYPSRNAFEEHSSKHLQDDGYPGYSCVFQSTSITAFICNICRGVHDTLQDLMKHWVTHEVIKFICTVCDTSCPSYSSFETHIALRCWKSKPNCRVWFNRQQHLCKICKSSFKTAEELEHHYGSNHARERECDTSNGLSSETLPAIETPPASDISISPRSKEKNSNKIVISNLYDPHDNHTAFINSTDPINTKSSDLDIENSLSDKSPLQELSTIKITIPNSIEQPVIQQYKDHAIMNYTTPNDNSQKQIPTRNESMNSSSPIDLSNMMTGNLLNPLLIAGTPSNKSLNSDESTAKFTESDTSGCKSKTIPTNNLSLNTNVDDAALKQMDSDELTLHQSTVRVDTNIETKIIEPINKIADKAMEISENDEPEIIEIRSNALLIPENFPLNHSRSPSNLIPKQNFGLENHKVTYDSSSNIYLENQEVIPNTKNINLNLTKSPDKINKHKCTIDSNTTKPRGFLRVKAFTELQAVNNYNCNQCSAAFDNMKSLNEHIIAHQRILTGNEKHPTMMAALILPQVDSKKITGDNIQTGTQSITQLAGRRILPCIPHRAANTNGRRANPLIHGQASNDKSQNLSFVQSVPNIQTIVQRTGQMLHMCPLCSVFRCGTLEELTHHLSINHCNINTPIFNPNLSHSNIPTPITNGTSTDRMKFYTCKVCKYTTSNKEVIVQHVKNSHVNQFQQTMNGAVHNNPESVHQGHLITFTPNNGVHSNTTPPYKCSLCTNYQYNTLEELAQHFQTVHQSIMQQDVFHPYVCSICLHPFQTFHDLSLHLLAHQTIGWT